MGTNVVPPPAVVPAPGDASPSARSFLQRIEQSLASLATLRIVTVVGDVSVAGQDLDTTLAVRPDRPTEGASTDIDLLNGHIVNVFSTGFSGQNGGALQAFHQAQVDRSSQIMLSNLAELQKLATSFASLRR